MVGAWEKVIALQNNTSIYSEIPPYLLVHRSWMILCYLSPPSSPSISPHILPWSLGCRFVSTS